VEIVRNLVQSLIVIIILAMFLEMLLPSGGMKSYVKMVMGLLVIIAVAQAVGNLARFDFSGELPSLTRQDDRALLAGIMEGGKKISGSQQEKAIEQYRRGLANQIMALARINKEAPVVGVEVKVQSERGAPDYGQLREVVLIVDGEARSGEKEAGRGVVAEVEPVTVRVGDPGQAGGTEPEAGPPREAAAGLVNTVAGFYNLKPEQVKVVYK